VKATKTGIQADAGPLWYFKESAHIWGSKHRVKTVPGEYHAHTHNRIPKCVILASYWEAWTRLCCAAEYDLSIWHNVFISMGASQVKYDLENHHKQTELSWLLLPKYDKGKIFGNDSNKAQLQSWIKSKLIRFVWSCYSCVLNVLTSRLLPNKRWWLKFHVLSCLKWNWISQRKELHSNVLMAIFGALRK
jgi:hypothetical protein